MDYGQYLMWCHLTPKLINWIYKKFIVVTSSRQSHENYIDIQYKIYYDKITEIKLCKRKV